MVLFAIALDDQVIDDQVIADQQIQPFQVGERDAYLRKRRASGLGKKNADHTLRPGIRESVHEPDDYFSRGRLSRRSRSPHSGMRYPELSRSPNMGDSSE